MSPVANPLFPGKHFIGTVLEALETKTAMSGELTRRYLQRAAMAGVVIGLLYATNFAIIAAFEAVQLGEASLRPLGKMAGALAFGWALVFIHYSKSELLTSNMMIVSIGAYHGRIGWWRALRLLSLCYIGNFLGGLFMALLLRFSTLAEGQVLAEMGHSVALKLAYEFARRTKGVRRPRFLSLQGAYHGDTATDFVQMIEFDNLVIGEGGPQPTVFHRGDANVDGRVDIADSIFLLGYLFRGTTKPRSPRRTSSPTARPPPARHAPCDASWVPKGAGRLTVRPESA